MAEPFYWEERKGYYVWIRVDGKRRRKFLAETKRAAFEVWKDGIASGSLRNGKGDPKFETVAGQWLELQIRRLERNEVSSGWVDRVTDTIVNFKKANPGIKCSAITPKRFTDWIGQVSVATEHTQGSTLKQILRWAAKHANLIDKSPLESLKLSKGNRREAIFTIDDHRKLVAQSKTPRIRCLLWFAWWTGTRPIELRELMWEDINQDCSRATLTKHKNARKTSKPRVIYFNHNAQSLLKKHRKQSGLVFLNARGRKWTKDAIVGRMRALRKNAKVEGTAYAYRHSYATRALEQGIAVADLAEIMGTSIEVISRNYAHLEKSKADRLDETAKRIK